MFTEWLLNHLKAPGPVGRAASIAWNEINNGQLPNGEHGLMRWRDHLHKRAGKEKGDALFKDFLLAYMEFKNEGY